MTSTVLYRKHELARALGVDHRIIDRMGLMPTASGPDDRPLYELESAGKQLEAHGIKTRKGRL
jgi:hypothetical protein